jgi:2-desacetyl-2-hydroxyethyl bacteriochlorophyllide A dehydrogenase
MQSLICQKPGEFEYQEKEIPKLTKGNSIIKIKRIGICGTDFHAFEGTQPFFNYPRILGHELSGELIDYDGNGDFQKGETLTFMPYFYCGTCIACRNGKTNCCSKMQVFGVHVDGGMAEYVSVPSYSLLHGNSLTLDALALVEPLAIGAHGVKRAGIKPGEFVLVAGAGPIGLGIVEFARIAGAKVIIADINEQRLNFCKEKMKVEYTINPASDNAIEEVRNITNGDMPTVVFDATGSQKAILKGFEYMAFGGRYVLVGLQKGEIQFSHPEFHKRESTLMSSRNAVKEDFEFVISCLKNNYIDTKSFITHTTKFSLLKEEFSMLSNPASGVIKAMVSID